VPVKEIARKERRQRSEIGEMFNSSPTQASLGRYNHEGRFWRIPAKIAIAQVGEP
jgi:hypothetical protein